MITRPFKERFLENSDPSFHCGRRHLPQVLPLREATAWLVGNEDPHRAADTAKDCGDSSKAQKVFVGMLVEITWKLFGFIQVIESTCKSLFFIDNQSIHGPFWAIFHGYVKPSKRYKLLDWNWSFTPLIRFSCKAGRKSKCTSVPHHLQELNGVPETKLWTWMLPKTYNILEYHTAILNI